MVVVEEVDAELAAAGDDVLPLPEHPPRGSWPLEWLVETVTGPKQRTRERSTRRATDVTSRNDSRVPGAVERS
jgi:hypothetical protein